MIRNLLLGVALLLVSSSSAFASRNHPNEPGWTHGVVLFGEAREKKDATPILQREYRPFHFYGNTVRRQYYRGTSLPSIGDGLQAVRVTITRD